MLKKAISTSLIGAMFVFSGCGDQEAIDRLEAQQQLDKGDYSNTVATLEAKTNRTDDENLILASAYMGQAGYSFSETMKLLADATNSSGDQTFSTFAADVHGKKSSLTLNTLQKAINTYTVVGTTSAPSYSSITRATSSSSTGDRDLYLGLAHLVKATTAIDYLGDASKIGDVNQDPDLLASSCAMVKVYAPLSSLPVNCSAATFGAAVVENNTTYYPINVQIGLGSGNYVRWANAAKDQMILTDYNGSTSVPSPIQIEGKDVTVEDVIVAALNDAFDYILLVAPDDVKDDITQFRTEVGTDANGNVTAENVAKYIANQN